METTEKNKKGRLSFTFTAKDEVTPKNLDTVIGYGCSICFMVFRQQKFLNEHREMTHNVKTTTAKMQKKVSKIVEPRNQNPSKSLGAFGQFVGNKSRSQTTRRNRRRPQLKIMDQPKDQQDIITEDNLTGRIIRTLPNLGKVKLEQDYRSEVTIKEEFQSNLSSKFLTNQIEDKVEEDQSTPIILQSWSIATENPLELVGAQSVPEVADSGGPISFWKKIGNLCQTTVVLDRCEEDSCQNGKISQNFDESEWAVVKTVSAPQSQLFDTEEPEIIFSNVK